MIPCAKRGGRSKAAGIVRADLNVAQIDSSYYGNILTLGMFIDWIEGGSKVTTPREVERLG
jgi:hypothetical protein